MWLLPLVPVSVIQSSGGGGRRIGQDRSLLHSEFEASLSYTRPCFRIKQQEKNEKHNVLDILKYSPHRVMR